MTEENENGNNTVGPEHDRLIKEVADRCGKSKFEVREFDEEGVKQIAIKIPGSHGGHWIRVYRDSDYENLLEGKFENWRFVGDLRAICSVEEQWIEALTDMAGRDYPDPDTIKLPYFWRTQGAGATRDDAEQLVVENGNIKISIGLQTDRLRLTAPMPFPFRPPSILIEGVSFASASEANEILTTYANSLFFDLEFQIGVPVMLQRYPAGGQAPSIKGNLELPDIRFPVVKYDPIPLDLYWYGRGADGMPLLRFLAYYQILEYYFSTFAARSVTQRVRNVLKNPEFRFDDDKQIDRLIASARTGHSNSNSSERALLVATIRGATEPNDLRDFLCSSENRKAHVCGNKSKLSSKRVLTDKGDDELYATMSDRIYDIRCRIVHAKADASDERLQIYPFSKESKHLIYDIEVVQFIACQVLISGSGRIRGISESERMIAAGRE
jgi:hypothetical protein